MNGYPPRKTKIFLASSEKSFSVAKALEEELSELFLEIIPWKKLGVFKLSEHTMESLEKIVNECDFGIFILGSDDLLVKDLHFYDVARDNVIFELGLFFGKVGRKRSYMLRPANVKIEEPSDLKGITWASYQIKGSNSYDLTDACSKIKNAISVAPLTPEETVLSRTLFPEIVLRYCLDTFKKFLLTKFKLRIPNFTYDAQITVCTQKGVIVRHRKRSSIGKKVYTHDGKIVWSTIEPYPNEEPFELLLRSEKSEWVLFTDKGFSQLFTDIKGRHNNRICVVHSFRKNFFIYFLEIHQELSYGLEDYQLNKIGKILGDRIIGISEEIGQINI